MKTVKTLGVATFVVALLAAGCGDDGNASDTTGQQTTTPAESTAATVAAPTGSELVIGVPVAVTGLAGPASKFTADVAQAWQTWVNQEKGGIAGHPVRLVIKDTKSDPATTAAVTKEMIEQDKVVAVVGANDYYTETVWAKAFADAGIADIPAVCYNPEACNAHAGVFHINTGIPAIVQAQDLSAKNDGATVFAVIGVSVDPSLKALEAIHKATSDAAGMTFGGSLGADAAAANYTAECLSLKNANVDHVQLSLDTGTATRVIADCRQQSFDPVWGFTGGSVIASQMTPLSKAGAKFVGALESFPWYVDDAPVAEFRDVMTKYASTADYQNPSATGTWAALELFRKALASADADPTAAEIMAAVSSVKNETLSGLLPEPVSFTAGQPSVAPKCFWVYDLSGETFSGSFEPVCAS